MYLIIKLGYIICLSSYKVREHVFDHQARLQNMLYHHTRCESMYLIIKLGYIICLSSYKVREHVFDHQGRLHNMFIIRQGARACI